MRFFSLVNFEQKKMNTVRKCSRIMHLAAPVGENSEFNDQYGPTQFRG